MHPVSFFPLLSLWLTSLTDRAGFSQTFRAGTSGFSTLRCPSSMVSSLVSSLLWHIFRTDPPSLEAFLSGAPLPSAIDIGGPSTPQLLGLDEILASKS